MNDFLEQLQFPVLLFGPDDTLEIVEDAKRLATTNTLGLKHRIVLNNLIIDGDGNCDL